MNRLFSSIVFVIPCLNHFRLNVNNSKAASQLLPIENPLFNACTFILAQVIMSNSYIYIYWLYFAIELLGCNTVIVYYIAFHCTYYSCMSIYRTWDLMVFEELYDDIRTPCCVVDPHPRCSDSRASQVDHMHILVFQVSRSVLFWWILQ